MIKVEVRLALLAVVLVERLSGIWGMYSDADGKPLTSRDGLLPCYVSAVVGCVMRPVRGCDWSSL